MKYVKKFFYLSLVILILLECIMGSQFSQVYAKTMTKQQVNEKIASLEQQIKTLQNQKKNEEANEKRERAGATYLYAEVICNNPYILHDTLSNGYFWVNDSRYLDNLWVAAIGYVKLTGNYRTYNGITCAECNSVKVTNKSVNTQKKITSKKKELKKYKNVLKDKVTLQNTRIKVGKTAKISRYWKYSGAYNTLTWKSSDKKIAAVDAKGKVTAIKEGTVTITAKASISGITAKCKVTVWEEEEIEQKPNIGEGDEGTNDDETVTGLDQGTAESKMYFSQQEYYLEDSRMAVLNLYVELRKGDDFKAIRIDSSNENVAVLDDWRVLDEDSFAVTFILTGAGTTTITAVADNGLSAQCVLTHYIDME